ncbi:MAG: HPF/RaiA family ribosome-associated protein [Chlorobium sp.]|uniref:HPF/RaiA family ribosome-associated protein n=1 Tax=Chlorobium sp. TaxID=1095 RepID=UPI001DF00B5B|nr:HPF/RaiA family ribosome-associated protein [Chlorobium sp.]MBN1279747.1 ribosome-associated translation inhibitor RaiA [Chlorobiaceae bacterium]MCF8215893.1 HPF/RaiA family ribosome-associated protein [Chlorobium sp.]MCF8270791.1 HPF/RaiA family ribosome-associated protein [Chlorobium sp.]MCF8287103.1 HPF/RaiA family ribosome-associated protein [Chlorobium sp.]MCF8290760.1 HPF/RaiA family ribosome-associated protein [Chlorobium sp.]
MNKSVVGETLNVQVTLRHSNNHSAIEDYARDAVQALLKVYPGILSCHIILDHQKNDVEKNKISEITVHVPQQILVSKDAAAAYEPAIDSCVDSLARQLQKYKDKMAP